MPRLGFCQCKVFRQGEWVKEENRHVKIYKCQHCNKQIHEKL
ncbi:hypothetical protein [Bacillus shivajii]|nr:hypothetical protein [Bacillus shivajii]